MKETDKAWTAGIIDGEGCIGVYKNNKGFCKTFNCHLNVANTNVLMLNQLKEFWGGKIYPDRHRLKYGWKECWVWQLNKGKEISRFLKNILPYLVVKKEQAEMMLEFIKTIGNPGKEVPRHIILLRYLIADELKKLKKI